MNLNFDTWQCFGWGQIGLDGPGISASYQWPAAPRSQEEHLSRRSASPSDDLSKERVRIARELHDTVLQGCLGASLLLEEAAEQASADSPSRPLVLRALKMLQRAISEGRQLVLGLRSEAGYRTNLECALYDLNEELAACRRAQYRVFVTGNPASLSPELQQQIYFIAREAVTNALRHSKATAIEAELQYSARRLCVIVRDNGCGIDPQVLHRVRNSGCGLVGMRERAESIDAQLKIWSKPGAGTEVEISIPISRVPGIDSRNRANQNGKPAKAAESIGQ